MTIVVTAPSPPGDSCVRSRLVAVIPAYNEASTIRPVVEEALKHVATVIVVDDGSTDSTAAAVADLPVTVLRHATNRGKSASLRFGLVTALREGAFAAITLDGDGQHDAADIPRLVAAHESNPGSIVIGTRLHERQNIPRVRYYANVFANYCVRRASGCEFPDTQSGFRIYPASLLRSTIVAENTSARFVFETEVLIDAARSGIPTVSVPIAARYPAGARASHFRAVLDVALIGRMLARKLLGRVAALASWPIVGPARR